MRRGIFLVAGLLAGLLLCGQEAREGKNFPPYPVLQELRMKSEKSLPAKVDLAKSKYFPPVFNQYGSSCNQASSIGYLFTYEMNRLRDLSGDYPENRYPPLYPWNFLNNSSNGMGVSYFDSWEIIKANGCPSVVDFPYVNDYAGWMSGYEKYYRGMQNRVISNYSLYLGDAEGIQMMKKYLYDHFDGSKFGGLANFQIASGGMHYNFLPDESSDPGAPYMTTFGTAVGHALTIVGYNDNIRFDRNGDGLYTNDIDVDGDRVVDVNDFEVGAFIIYNSWGVGWGRNGMAYLPYHLFGRFGFEGGIWNKSVHIVEAVKSYQPILTLRAELSHTRRGMIRIMAGVANDPEATEPEQILEFPMFNFQGVNALADDDRPDRHFELGLDITPLTSFIRRGAPVKFFLIVDEKDGSDLGTGTIYSFGVYNFFNGKDSVLLEGLQVPIINNSRTLVGLIRKAEFNRVEVTRVPRQFAKTGDYVSVQLEATGAASPYRWELVYDYDERFSVQPFPDAEGTLLFNAGAGELETKVRLPFDFDFYGEKYRYVIVTTEAEILFDPKERDYPYVVDTTLVLRSRKKIVAFGKPLDYYMEDNQIWYEQSDSSAQITWKAIAPTNEGPKPVKIACILNRDGRIRFFYDNTEFLHTGQSTYSLGVSNGDNRLFKQTSLSDQDEKINSILFSPARLPEETKLDATGWLFCRPMEAKTTYEIRVRVRDKYNLTGSGSVFVSTVNPDSVDILPQNFPNPFAGQTQITFMVPAKSAVLLEIFDLAGRRVTTLVDTELDASEYQVTWPGTNGPGQDAGTGIYICRIKVGHRRDQFKMIRTK
ncbi:MAG: hypothetical protein A2X22_10390 [Bacteroidetes bacterium GWF2_49_14]|nr:MAG: hypothetical protein A2X22_10390 [Bacteroidetes bacterium GWF2_49_14]